jgi:hypothetical protein
VDFNRVDSREINCCWSSPAQLFVVSLPMFRSTDFSLLVVYLKKLLVSEGRIASSDSFILIKLIGKDKEGSGRGLLIRAFH